MTRILFNRNFIIALLLSGATFCAFITGIFRLHLFVQLLTPILILSSHQFLNNIRRVHHTDLQFNSNIAKSIIDGNITNDSDNKISGHSPITKSSTKRKMLIFYHSMDEHGGAAKATHTWRLTGRIMGTMCLYSIISVRAKASMGLQKMSNYYTDYAKLYLVKSLEI